MVPLVFALALCLPAAPATAQDRSETTHDKTATIDFLDVGQGDAILIRSPEGKTALIDAGPSKEIVRLIRERGVKSIDLVVVSHHHADHYGGMDDVIRAFHPRFFLATDSSHTTPHYPVVSLKNPTINEQTHTISKPLNLLDAGHLPSGSYRGG